jgi:uncharacterized membrane protein
MPNRRVEWLFKELPKLVSEKIIDKNTATRIQKHYESQPKKKINPQLILMLFGGVGAFLLGGGIILILAHNWDVFPKFVRLFFGLLPLVIAQCLGGWVVYQQKESAVWRETVGALIVLFLGAAIAIVGQVYHLPSQIDAFLLVWSIGIIPTLYLLRSNLVLIIFLALITSWSGYVQDQGGQALMYWVLFAAILPYLIPRFNTPEKMKQNDFIKWLVAISLGTGLGITLEKVLPGLWIVIYSSYFVVLYLVGNRFEHEQKSFWQRPLEIIGMGGIGILTVNLCTHWPWAEVGLEHLRSGYRFHALESTVDYIVLGLFLSLFGYLLYRYFNKMKPYVIVFASSLVVAIVAFLLPDYGPLLFHAYAVVMIFSLLLPQGGVKPESQLPKYGYALMLFFLLFNTLFFRRHEISLLWAIGYNCFFMLLFIHSRTFLDKATNFLDGLFKFAGLYGGLLYLYIMSFQFRLRGELSYELMGIILMILIGTTMLWLPYLKENKKLAWFMAGLPGIGILSLALPMSRVLLNNVYFLAIGVGISLLGMQLKKLSLSNGGLLLVALLVLTRFFDTDMSFFGRGLVFIIIGGIFLGINIYVIKRKKQGGAA